MSKSTPKLSRRTSKIRPVLIDLMVVPPAFVTQRPFIPSRGHQIADELDLNKLGFPIINQRDGKYFIVDGQHRIFAMRQNGFDGYELPCEVYEDLTDEEMAETFLGRDDRTPIAQFVKFHIACTAGHLRENAIRRVVEAHGLKIKNRREENCVGAVSVLCRIYDTSPSKDVAVGWVVRVAKHAFSGDPLGFESHLLDALGAINNRYNGVPNSKLIEKDLIARLALLHGGARKLLQMSETLRDRTGQGKTSCLASVIIDIFNKHCVGRARIAPWFKENTRDHKSA